MMKGFASAFVLSVLLIQSFAGSVAAQSRDKQFTKTPLLADKEVAALSSEISGAIAKDTVIELSRYHRVQVSSGFRAGRRVYRRKGERVWTRPGPDRALPRRRSEDVLHAQVNPGMGRPSAPSFGRPSLTKQRSRILARCESRSPTTRRVRMSPHSSLTLAPALRQRTMRAKRSKAIVLAGGGVAAVHKLACDERGAAGVLSFQQNQVTGWSGDYIDNVRWGHLSPYNSDNRFAFMISLRRAREYQARLARGEQITLHATVRAEMKPSNYEVVSAIIPGADLAGEEIVFSCHLCHQKPGANDNASGAAAILEVARTLTALIRRGEIQRPRRTIRFIWPPEINGTVAYFAEHPEIVKRMKAAVIAIWWAAIMRSQNLFCM